MIIDIWGNSAADLGEANGKDGVRPAAHVVHACAACAAMGVAKCHKVVHVIVVGNQAFGQICRQSNARPFSLHWFFFIQNSLTLNVWAIQWVLPHSQSSVPVCSLLFQKIVHTFVVDLQVAGTKTNKNAKIFPQPQFNDVPNTKWTWTSSLCH